MKAVHAADFIALAKAQCGMIGDHMKMQIPNTLTKIEDRVVLHQIMQMHAGYTEELMPQQLGVGVKFPAELLVI